MTAHFGSTSARITGGRRVDRFLRRNPLDAAEIARRFARAFPLHTMRNAMPVRSGRLRDSLRIRQRGATVELVGAFYGRFVTTRSGLRVEQLWLRLARETLSRLRWFEL